MKKRLFLFDGAEGVAEMMVAVLNHYANVAYPLGGSDCAAASREALREIASTIMKAQEDVGLAELSRRQRPVLKAAVKWFYTESEYACKEGESMDPMFDRLLSQLEK